MTIRRTTTIRGGILPTSEHLFWGAIDLVQMGNISFLFQSCDNLQPITFWILGDVVGELVCNCREHWHQLDTSTTSQHTRPSISMTLLAFINASSALLWRFKTHALPKKNARKSTRRCASTLVQTVCTKYLTLLHCEISDWTDGTASVLLTVLTVLTKKC